MISFTLLSIFVITFCVVRYFNKKKQWQGLKQIPGPWAPPIIGNALQMGKLPHIKFNEWSKKYGDIYQVKLGPYPVVIISDAKMLKEIYTNDDNYVGRVHIDGFDMYEDESLGMLAIDGELWEVNRRFLLRHLRDFGFGKSAMESLILEEVEESISIFKKNEGKPIDDIKHDLTLSVVNSLWSVMASIRFQHDDPKILELIAHTNKVIDEISSGPGMIILSVFPWLRHICPRLLGYHNFRKNVEMNRSGFQEMVNNHKKAFKEDDLKDFMDVYLAEVNKTTDPTSVFYGERAERQLVALLSDLFFAGTETSSNTLNWAFLYLTKHPETQKKFQDEIDEVTNNSRKVSLADKENMPFTLALIDEVLRKSSIAPNGLQHRALEDKGFQGYFIAKDSWVMPNLHYLHHNPQIWGDPENFRPERFLSEDGKKYQKNENLLPFSIGKRHCVGKTLARDTIFLYLTNIFQRFTVEFDKSKPEPSMEPKPSIILNPHPFALVMKDRLL